jgi:hypothetical protein
MSNLETPPESSQWLAIIKATLMGDEELDLSFALYINKITSLLSRILKPILSRQFEDAAIALPLVLEETDAAEHEINDWVNEHPEYLHAGALEHAFRRYTFLFWRAARIKIHHFLILMINFVQYTPGGATSIVYDPDFLEQRRRLSYFIVASAARDILDSSLQALGAGGGVPKSPSSLPPPSAWFNALQLVWPLTVVLCVPTIPKESRSMARYVLGIIGRQRGILQALRSYPGGLNLPPEANVGIPNDQDIISFGATKTIE